MALVVADRVRESSSTTGTGTLTLAGAVTGFQTFSAGIGNTNTTYYSISNPNNNEWEVGLGTVGSGTLSRDTVLASSNANALVDFTAGPLDVFCTYPAGKSINQDASGNTFVPNLGGTTPSTAVVTTFNATGESILGGVSGSETMRVLSPSATGTYLQAQSSAATFEFRALGANANNGIRFVSRGSGPHDFTTGNSAVNLQFRVSPTSSSVNYLQVTGNTTGNRPIISVQGSDTNIGTNYQTKGSGQHVFYTNAGSAISLVTGAGGSNYGQINGAASGAAPTLLVAGSDANIDLKLMTKGTGSIRFNTDGGTEQLRVAHTASAVNYVQATGGATGNEVTLSGQGSDAVVNFAIATKSTGLFRVLTASNEQFRVSNIASADSYINVKGGSAATGGAYISVGGAARNLYISNGAAGNTRFFTGGESTSEQFRIAHTASAVNYLQVTGAAATPPNGVLLSAQGSDTNIPLSIGSKGTGYVNIDYTKTNFIRMQGQPTGQTPVLSVVGGDTNIGISLEAKGSSAINLYNSATATAFGIELASNTSVDKAVYLDLHASSGTDYDFRIIRAGGVNGAADFINAGTSVVRTLTGGGEQFRVANTASAVNFVQVTGAATANSPFISAQGSDTNIALGLYAKGNAATVMASNGSATFEAFGPASAVNRIRATSAIASGTPSLSAQGSDTNIGLDIISKGTGSVNLNTGSSTLLKLQDDTSGTPTASTLWVTGTKSGLGRNSIKSSAALWFSSSSTNNIQFNTNSSSTVGNDGSAQLAIASTTSAVNYLQVTGSTTGNSPTISSQGSDASVGLILSAKGTSTITGVVNTATRWRINADGSVDSGISASGGIGFKSVATASQVNYLQSAGSTADQDPLLSAQGSDTNISLALQSKGTGGIDLAAGSTGVNISNGTSVVTITRTASGSGYTSIPTTTISPPTLPGGVQAVAYSVIQNALGTTVASGGTGYTVNDVITMVGGTLQSGSAGTFTVTAVSGGVITAVTPNNFGQYREIPTNPVSVTGGTGTGATLNVVYLYGYAVFTNSGSGYVEQPSVTISGGGGSGAAAFATVGSMPIIRSLAGNGGASSALSFHTAGGESLRLLDGGLAANFLAVQAATTGGAPQFRSLGADTNIGILNSTKGSGAHSFYTNSYAQAQFLIAHTASAVNYLQVTGNTTGNRPTISAQGSDTNIALSVNGKGTGGLNLVENRTNYISVLGAGTSGAPIVSSAGADTNIDLSLTTKGTGAINFNTGNGTQFRVENTFGGGTATNYIRVQGRDTFQPVLSTAGASTNIALQVSSKGASNLSFWTNSSSDQQFNIAHTATAVNYLQVTGAVTGGSPVLSAQGSDANITLIINSKGNGSAALQSNGTGTTVLLTDGGLNAVRALPRAASGDTYLDVQRNVGFVDLIAGSGVTNGDIRLTPKGTGAVRVNQGATGATGLILSQDIGSSSNSARLFFDSSAGACSIFNGGGNNLTFRTSATIGSSSGSEQFRVAHTATAVNYVQVTGSATGGSPVISAQGSDANIAFAFGSKGASNINFFTNGTAARHFQVAHIAGSLVNYVKVSGSETGAASVLSVDGTDTNINLALLSKGSGALQFFTNSGSARQFQIANTASAVNYVQVTGAAASGIPVLSVEGSDASISFLFRAKGGAQHRFFTSTGNAEQFKVAHTAGTIANQATVTGAVAGSAPLFTVAGSDTNIDLKLVPKGTGNVSFGTYTGTALTIAGYIEIKDASGTIRKLAVVA